MPQSDYPCSTLVRFRFRIRCGKLHFYIIHNHQNFDPPFIVLVSTDTGQVGFPPLLLILLRSLHRIRRGVDTATRDNEVSTPADSRSGRLVLLTKLISLGRNVHTSREDHKVLLIRRRADFRLHLTQRARRHESHNEVLVFPGIIDRGSSVLAGSQGALRGHLCQDQQTAFGAVGEVRCRRRLSESLDDTLTRENAAVDDVGPFRDTEGTAVVLLLDRVADVNELAVLEDEKVVLLRESLKSLNGLVAEIREDIDVGFDHGNVGTETCSPVSPLISLHAA